MRAGNIFEGLLVLTMCTCLPVCYHTGNNRSQVLNGERSKKHLEAGEEVVQRNCLSRVY